MHVHYNIQYIATYVSQPTMYICTGISIPLNYEPTWYIHSYISIHRQYITSYSHTSHYVSVKLHSISKNIYVVPRCLEYRICVVFMNIVY